MGIEFRAYRMETRQVEETGRFTAYASVFGVRDAYGSVIEPGAFAKTLQEQGSRVPILWFHQPWVPIGMATAEEDDRGLLVRGELDLDTEQGRAIYSGMKRGYIDRMSIGFDVIKDEIDGDVRRIREVRLWEVSVLTRNFAANEYALIQEVRSNPTAWAFSRGLFVPDEARAATRFADLPLAPRDREWDADAAIRRVREWAGGPDKENIDWTRYRRAFFWYDESDPENFGSYKLPFADVIDGRLHAVPRAIFAAAAAIQGARGGVDIPEEDVSAVKAHIARYYTKMRREFGDDSIVPPWERSTRAVLTLPITLDELREVIGEALELRVGKVLSAANRAKVEAAIAKMREAIQALEELLAAADGKEPEQSTPSDDRGAGEPDEAHSLEAFVEQLRAERRIRELLESLRR